MSANLIYFIICYLSALLVIWLWMESRHIYFLGKVLLFRDELKNSGFSLMKIDEGTEVIIRYQLRKSILMKILTEVKRWKDKSSQK